MKESILADKLEELETKYNYDRLKLKMEYFPAKKDLLDTCTHHYDDGTSAKIGRGIVDDFGYNCAICGRDMD